MNNVEVEHWHNAGEDIGRKLLFEMREGDLRLVGKTFTLYLSKLAAKEFETILPLTET